MRPVTVLTRLDLLVYTPLNSARAEFKFGSSVTLVDDQQGQSRLFVLSSLALLVYTTLKYNTNRV